VKSIPNAASGAHTGAAVRPAKAWPVIGRPWEFAKAVLASFRANQGLVLAGAVAYYTLLSLIPLLILLVLGLSRVMDETRLLATLADYLQFAIPGASDAIVAELRTFLAHRESLGGVLLITMLIFSALAFTVLEKALTVIFFHRQASHPRRIAVSVVLPYIFILALGIGLLLVTVVSGKLAVLASRDVTVFGVPHSLEELSAYLLYMLGVAGEILMLTAIYLVLPAGGLSFRHALLGGVTAGLLWEMTRHVLVWYYASISQIRVVYGSLATAIAVLLSVEIAATFLLLGAQVIAEYERRDRSGKPRRMRGG
jgi:YihY family inner membrane protein